MVDGVYAKEEANLKQKQEIVWKKIQFKNEDRMFSADKEIDNLQKHYHAYGENLI